MKAFFQAGFTALLFIFTSLVQADGLCNLPSGTYSGKSDIIVDKSTGLAEQYYITLELVSDKKVAGKLQRHELVSDEKGRKRSEAKDHYFFSLEKCSSSDYRITSPDIDGYLQFVNINSYLNEITLTGSIYTYSDSILGSVEWLYESAKYHMGMQVVPDIDLTKLPIRLKQRFH